MIDHKNSAWAYLVLRLGTGVNLFMHGWVRIGSGFHGFQTWTMNLFVDTALPQSAVSLMTYLIPTAELVIGLLLIVGFQTRKALIAAAALIVSLIFGMSLLQKWEIVGLQMNYLVIYALLLFALQTNGFSMDRKLEMRKKS